MLKKALFFSLMLHVFGFVVIFHLYKRILINEAMYEEARYQIVIGKYPRIDNPQILKNADNISISTSTAENKLWVILSTDCFYCNKFTHGYLDSIYHEYVMSNLLNVELVFTGYLENSITQLKYIDRLYNQLTNEGKLSVIGNRNLDDEQQQLLRSDTQMGKFSSIITKIKANKEIANELGIYQFPTFILNDRVIKGLPGLSDFKEILDTEINKPK